MEVSTHRCVTVMSEEYRCTEHALRCMPLHCEHAAHPRPLARTGTPSTPSSNSELRVEGSATRQPLAGQEVGSGARGARAAVLHVPPGRGDSR